MNAARWTIGLLLILAAGTASAEKPSGPLKLALTAEPVASVPGDFDLTFTASSRRDVSNLTLSIELPASVTLEEGSLAWEGSPVAGEPVSYSLRVRTTGGTAEIVGRAEAEFSGLSDGTQPAVWSQATAVTLGEPREEKFFPKTRTSPGGQPIRGIRIPK